MARKQVDVEQKPGYEPYRKDYSWKKDLVAIRIPILGSGDNEVPVVSAGIDGVHYHIPRGEDVKVPRAIVNMLGTLYQAQWAMPAKSQMQGLVYLGKQPRFYVIELSGDKAARAKEIKPAAPLAAEQRVALENELIKGVAEDREAIAEISRAPVHADLEG